MAEVFFVAGEASGDLHASGVAKELRKIRPELKLGGIGGPRLAAAGVFLCYLFLGFCTRYIKYHS
ncbi:MAG: hypothetical protein NUW01_14985, partial [Gemmatimonadaceae bacterium]|nr:hypothetical protein [Gemmatimonadaceae bacterium]